MTSLRNLLRYLWDGLGGQMVEFSFTAKIPAQIALTLIIVGLVVSLTALCGRWEVAAPTAMITPTP